LASKIQKFRAIPSHASRSLSAEEPRYVFVDKDGDVKMRTDAKSERLSAPCPSSSSQVSSDSKQVSLSSFGPATRMLTSPGVTYKFRLADFVALSTSGSGIISYAASCDPSAHSLGDWTSLSGLFDECRLVGSRITVVGVQPGGVTEQMSFLLGYVRDITTTLPGSMDAVAALSDSSLHPMYTGSSESRVVKSGPGNRLWADTVTPATNNLADTGCVGAWWIYTNQNDNSAHRLDVLLEMFVEFRVRA